MNQWIEQFLRLISTNQNDWATMLPLATLVHNNSRNSTTQLVPNTLLYGLEPQVTPEQSRGGDNPLAELRVDQLRERRILATKALNQAANSKMPPVSTWEPGQKV